MLRIATEADVRDMLTIYAPYVVSSTATFEYVPPSQEEFMQRYQSYTAQFPWLVWEEGGRILGYAYASAPFTRAACDWCAEPTIYLRGDARGLGIGKKLYDALETILFRQGYQVLYALVTGENDASLRFHEKQGYRVTARLPECGFKFDRWLDLLWLEKRLRFDKIPSAAPKSWPSLMQNAEIFSDILDIFSLS